MKYLLTLLVIIPSFFFAPINVAAYSVMQTSIKGEISSSSVRPVISTLRRADSNTIVFITITSPGGLITAMYEVLDAVHSSKAARIIMIVPSYAYSAAAVIAVSGDELRINNRASLLYHTVQRCGRYCTPVVITPSSSSSDRSMINYYLQRLHQLTYWFLTPAQYSKIEKGINITIRGSQIRSICSVKQVITCGPIR